MGGQVAQTLVLVEPPSLVPSLDPAPLSFGELGIIGGDGWPGIPTARPYRRQLVPGGQ